MKELSNSEVNLVSGAGVVTNSEVGGKGHYQISTLPSWGPVMKPISCPWQVVDHLPLVDHWPVVAPKGKLNWYK